MGGQGAHYLLRVSVQKSEVDLAAQFLAKGGTLGGAAARGNTSLAISHADTHETFLLTETNQTIDLPLSDKLLRTSRAQYFAEVPTGRRVNDSVGPHVLLSDRTRHAAGPVRRAHQQVHHASRAAQRRAFEARGARGGAGHAPGAPHRGRGQGRMKVVLVQLSPISQTATHMHWHHQAAMDWLGRAWVMSSEL